MKVLHVLYDNIYSGAQNVVCQIVELFRKYDPETEMIYVSPDGPIREALEHRGVVFREIEKLSVKNLRKVILDEKPDLIHAHDMRASVISAMASGKIPLISHIHNNNYDSRGLSLKSIIYCVAAIKAGHIFWVSKSSYEGFKFGRMFEAKSSVLYNVVDCKKIQEAADAAGTKTAYDIVYVGRLTYQKNPERLVRIFGEVAKVDPYVTMAIIGDGELKGQTEKVIEKLPAVIRERIFLLGYQNNPYGIIKNARIMLMTSRWEGTPMCVLEAQELGVPLVSTPSDGIAEIIINGKNGFLEESDEELVNRCISLMKDPDRLMYMSKESKDFSAKYNDGRAYFDRVYQVYQDAIGNHD
ncbi:glycosyltransferase [Lachnospiraceae bacterium JC7]|nr:glycosyltransferase [Lachnospiraceae bacterium JC7]